MPNYISIKQLVIDETISNGALPTLERLTELVKETSQIVNGRKVIMIGISHKLRLVKSRLPTYRILRTTLKVKKLKNKQ